MCYALQHDNLGWGLGVEDVLLILPSSLASLGAVALCSSSFDQQNLAFTTIVGGM